MDRKHPHLPPAPVPHSPVYYSSFFFLCPAIHFTGIFDRVINFASDKCFGLVYIDKICIAGNTTVGRQRNLRKPPFPPLLLHGLIPITSSWRNTEYRAGKSNVKVLLFRTGCQKSDYDGGESHEDIYKNGRQTVLWSVLLKWHRYPPPQHQSCRHVGFPCCISIYTVNLWKSLN